MKKFLLPIFLIIISLNLFSQTSTEELRLAPKSDVYMQGFYWNSPPGGTWYDSLSKIAVRLASAGFGAIWIPPSAKGGSGFSMGYDIYDHYDFGEYNQKGNIETRFGSRPELENMIASYKSVGIELFYDAVMNHAAFGDIHTQYQCGTDSGYIVFNPASGRFPKTPANFHPNTVHCDNSYPYHSKDFFEDLCYYSGGTGDSLKAWGNYLINVFGFNGFRVDAIKHIDPAFMASFSLTFPQHYLVGEHWSSAGEIISYHNAVTSNGGSMSYFDFPLRYSLRDMCNNLLGNYNMNNLDNAGLVNAGMSGFNVSTFVENHDVDRVGWDGQIANGHDPVLYDKDMAYAYIIFSEGRPSVFFKDYFDYGNSGVIDTLIWIRQNFLGGTTTKRNGLNPYYIREDGNIDQGLLSGDIYVARRNGFGEQPGGYLLLNDHPNQWIDVWVDTDLPVGTWFKDFSGKDVNKQVQPPDGGGSANRVKLWCPPRTFTIYVADTTQVINNPPVLARIPDLTGYTNSAFDYKLNVIDVNNDPLTFTLSGNPAWLSVNQGRLIGTPSFSDTTISTVILQVSDGNGGTDADTFKITVELNFPPSLGSVPDTTIKATMRFERQLIASDPDNDSLLFKLTHSPSWLNLGASTGLLSGTPAPEDTGSYVVKLNVMDGKGAYDSTAFNLNVIPNSDSIITTYGKPFMDGNINISIDDWREEWQITVDPDSDSFWRPAAGIDNELLGIFATWDADSLYLGIDYVINDNFNSLMLYVDAGLPGGVTNFNSTQGYNGDYAKNFRFRPADAIDFFTASYYHDNPSVFMIDSNSSININDMVNSLRGDNGRGSETAIAWDDIYGLGAGLIPQNVKLKMVAVVAGGFNYGAGDSSPDNPDVNGDAGPDSLIFLAEISPDENGDGIPDPTIIISSVDEEISLKVIPDNFYLYQNYPNPFNPKTNLRFTISDLRFVTLKVYDILGKEVATLVNDVKEPGDYEIEWNAGGISSGIYFYTLQAMPAGSQAGGFVSTKKLVLMK